MPKKNIQKLTYRDYQSLLDEIINSINILADKALTSVETGLLNAPPTSIGFGNLASSTNANSKSKRKRKQHPDEEDDNGAVSDLSPEQIEDQAHAEIAAGTHQLETLLCTSIDRNFDKFELYVMRNILCVKPEDRDWIRLGHYDGLNFDNLPATVLPGTKKNSAAAGVAGGENKDNNNNDDGNGDKMDIDSSSAAPITSKDGNDDDDVNLDIPTITSVNKLRRRLQASQKLNALLAAEKTRNDALLNELRSIAGRTSKAAAATAAATAHATSEDNSTTTTTPPLAFLHNKGDLTQADAATPLTTTTAFALSQMQALRALSTSLSNILPDLNTSSNAGIAADTAATASGGESDATKTTTTTTTRRTWRKERVEYIEGAARRHLEAVRGLELDQDGEIRDGEWQGEGPRVGAEEFAALEGVLDLLDKKVVSAEGKSNGSGSGNGDVDVDVGDNGDNAGTEGDDDDDAAKQGAATAS